MKQKIDLLSSAGNMVIAKHSDRNFPGALIQGDTLRILLDEVEELRDEASSGDLEAIRYIANHLNGEKVALNNRSLTALRRAGIQPTNLINRTGSARHEKLLNQHLGSGSPSDFIRIRGGSSGTSNIQ